MTRPLDKAFGEGLPLPPPQKHLCGRYGEHLRPLPGSNNANSCIRCGQPLDSPIPPATEENRAS